MTKSTSKKVVWLARSAGLLLFFVLLVVILATYSGGTSPGFQEYKPVNLPNDLRVESEELYIQRYPKFLPSFSRHINLNLNLANSWIEENKSDGQAFYNNWCQSYQSGSPCRQYQTSQRQRYLLSTYITDSTRTSDQQVYFIKGGTSIWITLTKYPELSEADWGKLIDSFQPTRYNHPKIFRGSTQGP